MDAERIAYHDGLTVQPEDTLTLHLGQKEFKVGGDQLDEICRILFDDISNNRERWLPICTQSLANRIKTINDGTEIVDNKIVYQIDEDILKELITATIITYIRDNFGSYLSHAAGIGLQRPEGMDDAMWSHARVLNEGAIAAFVLSHIPKINPEFAEDLNELTRELDANVRGLIISR